MSDADWFMPVIGGGIFIILGLAGLFWGKREQKSYDYRLASRADLRELMEHWPARPEPGALKLGGGIALVIGLVLLLLGVVFLIRG